jgi:hypothetical protein
METFAQNNMYVFRHTNAGGMKQIKTNKSLDMTVQFCVYTSVQCSVFGHCVNLVCTSRAIVSTWCVHLGPLCQLGVYISGHCVNLCQFGVYI